MSWPPKHVAQGSPASRWAFALVVIGAVQALIGIRVALGQVRLAARH